MGAVEVQHYLGRARDFFKGMDLLKDDLAEFRFSSALLGIHSAISYSDALRIGLGCADISSDNHQNAAGDLRSRLASRRFEKQQGANHLERLLSKKSRIAYTSDAAREDEIEDIVKRAKRFAEWAEATGEELRIEGW
jgi:virulence-associated protein VapD